MVGLHTIWNYRLNKVQLNIQVFRDISICCFEAVLLWHFSTKLRSYLSIESEPFVVVNRIQNQLDLIRQQKEGVRVCKLPNLQECFNLGFEDQKGVPSITAFGKEECLEDGTCSVLFICNDGSEEKHQQTTCALLHWDRQWQQKHRSVGTDIYFEHN